MVKTEMFSELNIIWPKILDTRNAENMPNYMLQDSVQV